MGAHLKSNSRYETGALWLQYNGDLCSNQSKKPILTKERRDGDARNEYLKETVDGDIAQVETKTKLKEGTVYSVNYKLNSGPAGWRVYDVVVEGVSLVNN